MRSLKELFHITNTVVLLFLGVNVLFLVYEHGPIGYLEVGLDFPIIDLYMSLVGLYFVCTNTLFKD